ncbi:MAG TPA: hypothetical protein VFV27_12120 [Nevskiaceae bacterium]|nr:hypothetical protein [Nevskiaceae bacterium]
MSRTALRTLQLMVGLGLALMAPLSSAASPDAVEGVLIGAWADPHPKARQAPAAARFVLVQDSGERLRLTVSASLAAAHLGERVILSGRQALGPVDAGYEVRSIRRAQRSAASERGIRAAATERSVLYLLVRYADDSEVPFEPAFYEALNNPLTPPEGSGLPATLNGFYHAISYGQFQWRGEVGGVGGVPARDWLTLSRPKSGYADCGWQDVCADLDALLTEAMDLAVGQGIDVTRYDNINLVLSNDLDCCAWGGGGVYNGRVYGVTWEPPWGQNVDTYAHEMGHSLGLPHSGWTYYDYDSHWDAMSRGASAEASACGRYASRNSGGENRDLFCVKPGAGYIAPHLLTLGWLPEAQVVQVQAGDPAVSVTLESLSSPLSGHPKMVRICLQGEPCTGPDAHYLSLEVRSRGRDFDNALPGEGLVLHDVRLNRAPIGDGDACYFNSQSGWAVVVDATPGDWRPAPDCNSGGRVFPDFALHNAAFEPGDRYQDAQRNLSISVVSRNGEFYTVSIDNQLSRPLAPGPLQALAGDGEVQLSWPAVNGAEQYEVFQAEARDFSDGRRVLNGLTQPEARIGGLSNGRRYYFQVTALNGVGRSPRSPTVSALPQRLITVVALDQSALAATAGAERRFEVVVPRGAVQLLVASSGGSGDADLYVARATAPVAGEILNDASHCTPYRADANESCEFLAPAADRWPILLHAYSDYSGVSLRASYQVPEDTRPLAFDFTDQSASAGSRVRSLALRLRGTNAPAPFLVEGHASGGLMINGAAPQRSGSLQPGDRLVLQMRAPAAGGSRSLLLTIGGVRDRWTVTAPP